LRARNGPLGVLLGDQPTFVPTTAMSYRRAKVLSVRVYGCATDFSFALRVAASIWKIASGSATPRADTS